jgi:hypothetical protein
MAIDDAGMHMLPSITTSVAHSIWMPCARLNPVISSRSSVATNLRLPNIGISGLADTNLAACSNDLVSSDELIVSFIV